MYERVLIPLDGSELAEGILPYMEELARRFDSELILLQAVTSAMAPLAGGTVPGVVSSPTGAKISAEAAQEAVRAEMRAAQDYLASIGQRLQGKQIRARVEIVEGSPGAVILETAAKSDVSLIAMSTHGRGGLGRLVFGSVADEVVRSSRVPVFLVRPEG